MARKRSSETSVIVVANEVANEVAKGVAIEVASGVVNVVVNGVVRPLMRFSCNLIEAHSSRGP